jgi:hypothetical protein
MQSQSNLLYTTCSTKMHTAQPDDNILHTRLQSGGAAYCTDKTKQLEGGSVATWQSTAPNQPIAHIQQHNIAVVAFLGLQHYRAAAKVTP